MSETGVTKREPPEESSTLALAAKRLKKQCAHKNGQIKFLKHLNRDLRATDLWRVQKMERQAFEIWKLKLLLSEAGYDSKNLPQPKIRVPGKAEGSAPAGTVKTPAPRSRSTSPNPSSLFKYSNPAPKRKRAESFSEDDEFNPHPKRRALSLTSFLESNIYACEETYTQYLVDHQLGYAQEMDVDEYEEEDDDEEEESEEKPENPASRFKEYLTANNLPEERQLETARDIEIQERKEQAQPVSNEYQRYQEELDIAIMRSLEDMREKGKDEGGIGEKEAEEAPTRGEDEVEDPCAEEASAEPGDEEEGEEEEEEEGEEGEAEHEDEEKETSGEEEEGEASFESGDEEEEASDEDEEKEEALAEPEDEEKETGDEDEGEDEGEEEALAEPEDGEETCDEDEGEEEGASGGEKPSADHENREDSSDEEGEEEATSDKSSEPMDEDGAEGEVLVSEPSETGDNSGGEENEVQTSTPAASMTEDERKAEARMSKQSEHDPEEEENAQAASLSSDDEFPDLQYALELSMQRPSDSDEEEQPPISQSAGCRTILPPSLVGSEKEKKEKGVPVPKPTQYFSKGGEEAGISKEEYSELERAIAMSLESLRGKGWRKEARKPTFRAREHLSEDYDREESPVPEPFEYHSDSEEGAEAEDLDL